MRKIWRTNLRWENFPFVLALNCIILFPYCNIFWIQSRIFFFFFIFEGSWCYHRRSSKEIIFWTQPYKKGNIEIRGPQVHLVIYLLVLYWTISLRLDSKFWQEWVFMDIYWKLFRFQITILQIFTWKKKIDNWSCDNS